MPKVRTELVLLPAGVDELARREAGVARVLEHRCSLIESATEAATDREETGREGGDQSLQSYGVDVP